jgi:DNA-binding HxlR family transcriptional regulator
MSKCRIENTIEFLGRKHMLSLLKLFHDTSVPMRYTEIKRQLGINTKTLSDRLSELEQAGLIIRRSYDEVPPREEYTLTSIGNDLETFIREIHKFELKHLPQNATSR